MSYHTAQCLIKQPSDSLSNTLENNQGYISIKKYFEAHGKSCQFPVFLFQYSSKKELQEK